MPLRVVPVTDGRVAAALVAALLGVLALLAVAPPADATDFCVCAEAGADCGMGPPSVLDTVYVRIDAILSHGYLFSIWVYLESNGIPGLQSGGTSLLGDEDVCQTTDNPDTLIL